MERLSIETLNNVLNVMGTIEKCCGGFDDSFEIAKFEFLKKLKEYMDLEKQGKLLKLPVAVGDTVYAFDMAKVIELKLTEISLLLLGGKVVINVKCQNTDCFRNFVKEEFGKTVFLTKEEAEAALKEMGE